MRVPKLTLPRFLSTVLLTCLSVNYLYSQSLKVDVTITEPSCGGSDGIVLITATGTPPYTYSVDGNLQNTGYFSGLRPGRYSLVVRDATSSFLSSVTLFTQTPPLLTATNVNNPSSCNGDGSVALSATGGTPPYQYSLYMDDNYQSSNVFTGLANGDYLFYVMDANGCIGTTKVNLRDYNCSMVVYAWVYSGYVSCEFPGFILVNGIYGGTPPYQYSIDGINFQSGNSFNNLAPGVYTITVKDATGFTRVNKIQMFDACRLDFTYVAVDAACKQHDGSITITARNGNPPYTYSIDGINYQPGNVFSGLASGNYTVTIKDAFNRTVSKGATVNDPCPQVSLAATGETCQLHDGTITASATKGTPPFQYSIDGVNFQTNNVFTGLDVGDYTITLKDALAFTSTATIKVHNACISVSAVATNSTCGNSNGSIVISVSNGTAPYQYSIDGVNFQPGNSFTGVGAGTYTVWARDVAGKINNTTITVNNTTGPQVNATSTPALCTNIEGTITISAVGGTTPYQFSIDNGATFSTSNVFSGLPRSDYVATVKDANGCLATQVVAVPITDNLLFNAGVNPTICEGSSTVFNCISNGNSFNWSPSTGLSNPSILNPSASPATTTTYNVVVSLGVCVKMESVTVFVKPAPVADAGNGTTICYGQSAQLSGAGGLSYNWTPVAYLSDAAIADPIVGHPSSTTTYALTVTDGNGCQSIQPSTVTISVTPPAKVFAGNDTSIVMDQPFSLQAKDVNNSGFTQYVWSPSFGLDNSAAQNPVALLDRNMTYTVMATTPQGCSGTDAINIKVYKGPEIYVPNAFSPNSDGHNDVLRATPVGIKEFKYFNIYNRWGQLVFSTKDPSRGWSGEISHVLQASGTFVWMAEGLDGKGNAVRRKGTVTLIR
ncbi:MAG TPA: gliding motility-associated C-terminal domain-containing protein [Niastella sp.]